MQYNYLIIDEDSQSLIVNREITVDEFEDLEERYLTSIIDLNTMTEFYDGKWQPIPKEQASK